MIVREDGMEQSLSSWGGFSVRSLEESSDLDTAATTTAASERGV